MADIRFEQATRLFRGADAPAVDRLDLELEDGELLVLVGPSGSGKSTALRMLAGLEEVDAGAVYIGGRDVTDVAPKRRDIAMVFQNYALYPYLDVRANIGFPLKMAGVPKSERERRVSEAAEMLGLTPLLDRKPAQLSGGERQRAAMGRAIVRNPQAFLMDEPLSNLDAKLRVKMRVDIAALQRRLGVTTLYVTHDQVEAMTMGHRVAVLHDGRLQQCGPPRELYNRPANLFVAGFIGSPAMNLCRARVNGEGAAELCGVTVELQREIASAVAAGGLREIVLGLRPESLEITASEGMNGSGGIPAEVEVVEELGADAYAFCVARPAGSETRLIARTDWRRPPAQGANVVLRPRPGEAHAFNPETGERLGA
jgi:multiple sugar transport system ATP-binding protein